VTTDGLSASVEKMRREGLGDAAVANFEHYYARLRDGDAGVLPEDELEPVTEIPSFEELEDADAGEALDQTVVLKLNGGLGTSMGMTKAKSLLEIKDGMTFLDIIARQVLRMRERHGARLPLVLMNSFATRDDSLELLSRYDDLEADVPADFVQNKVPKLLAEDLTPVEWPDDPDKEWSPPGHGDLYTALVTSGMLDQLLDAGYRYAFVSNSDNLGAILEPRTLAWFAGEEIPFLIEVIDRTEADKKGGHIAHRREGGGLVLREIAQTPDEDVEAFQDTSKHRYFNANTIWLNLPLLKRTLDEQDGVLGLPMIVNRKTVDPGDKSSPEVIQLETAMGAAIDVFEGAQALHVPRERFIPVKTTNDLLVVRSDAYELDDDFKLVLRATAGAAPLVDLDGDHFKLVDDFEAHFPAGPPSLVGCRSLHVKGDVRFGRGVVCRDEVVIEGPGEVPDHAVLEGFEVLGA
jgi:UTP--glucose-1-phosphate uridylyltransferase